MKTLLLIVADSVESVKFKADGEYQTPVWSSKLIKGLLLFCDLTKGASLIK